MYINVYIYTYTHIYLRSDLEGRCSTAAIDLVKRCLTRDPIARITAQVLHFNIRISTYEYIHVYTCIYLFETRLHMMQEFGGAIHINCVLCYTKNLLDQARCGNVFDFRFMESQNISIGSTPTCYPACFRVLANETEVELFEGPNITRLLCTHCFMRDLFTCTEQCSGSS